MTTTARPLSETTANYHGAMEEAPQEEKQRDAAMSTETTCSASRHPSETVSTSIQSLPNELLSHILEKLDVQPPSAIALYDEPHFALTRSSESPLKAASLVSKRWREASKLVLFRCTQFTVPDPEITESRRTILTEQVKPYLDFITSNALQKAVRSFALLVEDREVTNTSEGPRSLNEFASFWSSIFETVDPVTILIVAAPQALGALTSCHVYLEDAWTFDCPYHYLLLQRPSDLLNKNQPIGSPQIIPEPQQVKESLEIDVGPIPLDQFHEEEIPRASSSALFEARPWSKLLLNEGSFIRAYKTYEFWLRVAPSILSDLVGAGTPNNRAYISPTIRDFSYVGMFPMLRHFCVLAENLPRLDRLFVQLVPRNDILQQANKMLQIEPQDLWMERNASYASLMREMFNTPPSPNYQHLKSKFTATVGVEWYGGPSSRGLVSVRRALDLDIAV
ncbi:F-box domain-containing protein [Diplocarpon rosae]|nr:F-box domain-containing protein [Diplocarpon rosae]